MRSRVNNDAEKTTRTKLLDAAESIMLESGYAAVSARKVAKSIGVTAAVVNYYFPTMEDLFVSVYRRANEQFVIELLKILRSDDALHGVWELNRHAVPASLAAEFMALANHRKPIQSELARAVKYTRIWQANVLEEAMARGGMDLEACPPLGVAVIISSIARTLAIEAAVGVTAGHAEVWDIAEQILQLLQKASR